MLKSADFITFVRIQMKRKAYLLCMDETLLIFVQSCIESIQIYLILLSQYSHQNVMYIWKRKYKQCVRDVEQHSFCKIFCAVGKMSPEVENECTFVYVCTTMTILARKFCWNLVLYNLLSTRANSYHCLYCFVACNIDEFKKHSKHAPWHFWHYNITQ